MTIIENAIENSYKKLSESLSNEYLELYDSIGHEKLKIIFSTLHTCLINLFDRMNERLPTRDETAHFWAYESRQLIEINSIIESLERSLKHSEFSFTIAEDYRERLSLCKVFLKKSGGSEIPPNTAEMELYSMLPIFSPHNAIVIDSQKNISNLQLIGQGSYAQVFKYTDKFYKKDFAIKRAKKDLQAKEIERFRREYEEMSRLNSPYILEVFNYNETKIEYIMEFMDTSLHAYILSNNTKTSFQDKKKIGNQIIRAFTYIHSKGILHRDISPHNILIKIYDDVEIIKVSDFGLVKIADSILTSIGTDFKGSFNDPNLLVEGFDTYNRLHETFALTRILYFVLTGKTRTDKVSSNFKGFIEKGPHNDKNERYKNIEELALAFQSISPI